MENLLARIQSLDVEAEYSAFSDKWEDVVTTRQDLDHKEADLEVMAHNLFDNMIAQMAVSHNPPSCKARLIVLYRIFSEDSGYSLADDKRSVEDVLDMFGINH